MLLALLFVSKVMLVNNVLTQLQIFVWFENHLYSVLISFIVQKIIHINILESFRIV